MASLNECYSDLAAAIMELAVRDYRDGYLMELNTFGKKVTDEEMYDYIYTKFPKFTQERFRFVMIFRNMLSAKEFFLSNAFTKYAPNISGTYVIEQIEKIGFDFVPYNDEGGYDEEHVRFRAPRDKRTEMGS